MIQTNGTIKSVIINYGLLLGGLTVAFALMLFLMDMHIEQGSLQNIVGFILTVGAIVFGQLAFKKANMVILCPLYTAGEKIKLGFDYIKFAKEIIKNSDVKLFLVNNKFELARFLKKNIFGKKIVIGMGAGTISNWMRELPKLMK